MEQRPKKLLDWVRDAIRFKHHSIRTEEAYVNWVKRYIYFHDVRHPAEMGAARRWSSDCLSCGTTPRLLGTRWLPSCCCA